MQLSRKTLFTACLIGLAAASLSAATASTPSVWIAPSLHRVGMTDPAGSETQVKLWAARGEYESFQIVANGGSQGLGGVNVTVSDLRSPDGQVISHTAFTLYREKYVHVTASSPNWK